MDFQQIRYVIALSRELNFQRAARSVHVTQPTLSQQIQKLETELGAPLFERSSRGVRLTEAGKRFLPHAFTIMDAVERSREETGAHDGEVRGTVRLAAIPTVGPYIFADIITHIRKKAPGIHLELYEEQTSVLTESLKNGRIDIGLLSLPFSDSTLATREVCREEFFLAVSRAHPLAARKQVNLAELNREKLLILQEGHCFGDQTLEYCRRSRRDSQIIFEGGSLTSVVRLAATGEGVTLVPRIAVRDSTAPGLKFLSFTRPAPSRVLVTAWRISAPLTGAQKALMDIISSTLKKKACP